MNENKQTTEALYDIFAEMRNVAKDSYAEKTAKRLEDHEATGTRDALDINDAIQCLRDDDKYLLDLADRIEAAVTRMQDAYCDLCKEKDAAYDRLLLERDRAIKASTPSNVAAIRAVLEQACDIIRCYEMSEADGEFSNQYEEVCEWFKRVESVLTVPARNCDVGTPKEQEERFNAFCDSHWDLNNVDGECMECPLNKKIGTECEFAWMQMPYEGKE